MNDRWAGAEDDSELWSELHGGNGEITVRHYFAGELPWPIDIDLWEIPVGGSEGPHAHGPNDPDGYAGLRECYVIVEGRARVLLGHEWRELGAGDAVIVDPLTPRAIHNIGLVPLRVMFVSDRPSPR